MSELTTQQLVLAFEETLTIDNMRAWASSFPADQVLGHSSKGGDCPIARFLRSRLHAEVFVGRGMWTQNPTTAFPTQWHVLPTWAKHFVWVVDTCFKDEVTTEQVLTALDECERQVRRMSAAPVNWSEIQSLAANMPASLKIEEKVLVPA